MRTKSASVNRRLPTPRCAVARGHQDLLGIDKLIAPHFDGGVTKAGNRAAAKAWYEEWRRQRDAEVRAKAAEAELSELDRLRRFLIHERTLGYTPP